MFHQFKILILIYLFQLGLKRGLDGAWIPPPQSTPAASLLGLDEDDEDMNDDLIKTPFDLG